MGYIRPLVQGVSKEQVNRRPLLALAGGFIVSAVLIYAVLWITGLALGLPHLSVGVRLLVASGVILIGAAADSGRFPLRGLSWQRQTPRIAWVMFGPTRAALLWGFDAGLAFTTYRITSLTWVGFGAALLHLAPWWSGLMYGAAFIIPTASDILRPAGARDETLSYLSRYSSWERQVRTSALGLLLFLGIASATAGAMML